MSTMKKRIGKRITRPQARDLIREEIRFLVIPSIHRIAREEIAAAHEIAPVPPVPTIPTVISYVSVVDPKPIPAAPELDITSSTTSPKPEGADAKPMPAPWTPKVGELCYSTGSPCVVEHIIRNGTRFILRPFQSKDPQSDDLWNVARTSIPPLTDAEWIVIVAVLEWLNNHRVPIKPYEEGK